MNKQGNEQAAQEIPQIVEDSEEEAGKKVFKKSTRRKETWLCKSTSVRFMRQ